jgi:NAD-dependent deacetylase sirtuin 1
MNKGFQKKRKLIEVENNNLNRCINIQDVTELLKKSRNILVITGAGISVSCGIPDFRSKENGLYNTLDCASIGIPSAELLFDLQFFLIDPEPFYYFAKSLLPCDNIQPSICHQFISLLEKKKKLLRNYTQNVDCLEKKVGITKVIECHGSLSVFKCIGCKNKNKINAEIITTIKNGEVPYCKKCRENGVLKPEITFFGEKVPDKFTKTMLSDISKGKCDCKILYIINFFIK